MEKAREMSALLYQINLIDFADFTDLKSIGKGRIHKAKWNDCKTMVALKSFQEKSDQEKSDQEKSDQEKSDEFLKELKAFTKICCHPNIIEFYGITKDSHDQPFFIFEYANNGTLREYLAKNYSELSWNDKSRIALEISDGLRFMHRNNIIHRDLHIKNVLIHDGTPKIANFGPSLSSDSIAYMDPEYFLNDQYKRTMKSDVYSFGVMLWEISSGKEPFKNLESQEVRSHILKGEREIPVEGTPPEYIELYKRCWSENPTNRPDTKVIHEFLETIFGEIEDQIPTTP
ncbi:kinase-like protein [Gigaspora margarita]|uniref:Kinase-like protein n=1 Tax=Gigaspora margarita TaxID=4874 RepID=A0A8H4AIE6_GIGMA|nr:kinase-like protein [Gigaspora margarita]